MVVPKDFAAFCSLSNLHLHELRKGLRWLGHEDRVYKVHTGMVTEVVMGVCVLFFYSHLSFDRVAEPAGTAVLFSLSLGLSFRKHTRHSSLILCCSRKINLVMCCEYSGFCCGTFLHILYHCSSTRVGRVEVLFMLG